jgi:hypothetical protein
MQEIWRTVVEAIRTGRLPENAKDLFGELYSEAAQTFPLQESLHWDYKQDFPGSWNSDYFGGILRLICAFHNTYGGIIIFGVHDSDRTLGHNPVQLDVERLNAVLAEWLNSPIECLHRRYDLSRATERDACIDVLLVPKRPFGVPPARFVKNVGKYHKGILYARYGHQVLEVEPTDISFLYSSRDDYGLQADYQPKAVVHRSLPPSAATLKQFIGRVQLMDRLWSWLVLEPDQPRLFLYGPGGSGKSTLAYEFARCVANSSVAAISPEGAKIDFVIYLSGKKTELDPKTGKIQEFTAQDFTTAEEQYRKILNRSGWLTEAETEGLTKKELLAGLKQLLSEFYGLIVIDDIDTLARDEDPGMEDLFKLALRSQRGAKILYTLRNEPRLFRENSEEVPGLVPDDE